MNEAYGCTLPYLSCACSSYSQKIRKIYLAGLATTTPSRRYSDGAQFDYHELLGVGDQPWFAAPPPPNGQKQQQTHV
jgi:hypothetical protein